MSNFDHLLGFHNAGFLGVDQSQPDKGGVETDHFSGSIRTSGDEGIGCFLVGQLDPPGLLRKPDLSSA